ncbi:MAG: aminoacyl-histidine dipeptidase [Peptostreptococcaceae bacterium]|nr:aminoacyl-histidine dipeptidase [Peptostreptococcaceae bacterium]
MEETKGIDSILGYFREICKIPRCSGNEKAVSDFLLNFAVSHGVEAIRDDSLNIIMKKPATIGYESSPAVMLQGHMDMVCVKTAESEHDFESNPLDIEEMDGFLSARETSLGADNGVAVAYIMAIVADKKLKHPALECVITTSEETGMDGVIGLDTEGLKSKILINLDSEEEGVFLASSAGGVNNQVNMHVSWENAFTNGYCSEICIKGLKGGHSGSEIDKGRGNAIKLMGRLMAELDGRGFRLLSIDGGSKRNAIAGHCRVQVVSSREYADALDEIVVRMEGVFRNELKSSEPELKIEIEEKSIKSVMLDKASMENLVSFLRLVPCGVQTMSGDVPKLVESSINLGVIKTEGNDIIITSSVRSSVESLKNEINGRIGSLCGLLQADMKLEADYPGWEFVSESYIREIMKKTYGQLFGKEPVIKAIHAGLECGFLKEKMPGLDIISIGPDMFDVHSTRERLDIASTERTWQFIVKTLENIK